MSPSKLTQSLPLNSLTGVIVVVEGGVVRNVVMADLFCIASSERTMTGVWSRLSFAGVV